MRYWRESQSKGFQIRYWLKFWCPCDKKPSRFQSHCHNNFLLPPHNWADVLQGTTCMLWNTSPWHHQPPISSAGTLASLSHQLLLLILISPADSPLLLHIPHHLLVQCLVWFSSPQPRLCPPSPWHLGNTIRGCLLPYISHISADVSAM